MTNDTANKIDLSRLTSDGDTVDLADGRTLRLKVWHDDTNPFEEYETYGRIQGAWWHKDHEPRPEGFDGNAEKLRLFDGSVWWQPPVDGPKRGAEEFAKFWSLVIELASFGMHGVALEVLQGEDAYRCPIVVAVESLGGIDSLEDGYLAEVVWELASELGIV